METAAFTDHRVMLTQKSFRSVCRFYPDRQSYNLQELQINCWGGKYIAAQVEIFVKSVLIMNP